MRNCDWEQRKLGELSEIVRGASPRPIQDPKWFDTNSDVGWLRISDVTEQNGRIYFLEQKISKAGQEKTRVLVEPHLLLSIAATVGKPVVNYVKTGVHDGFLIFLNPIFEREYMFQWLEMFRPKWMKYGQPGSQVNLNSELVRNQDILLPSKEEQTEIGLFFKHFDDTIALHQRKLTLLKQLKQTYLKQIFPQNKENMPALRFAGFSEPWKQRKFDEVFSHVQNNSLSRADLNYKSGYAMNIHYGDILIRFGEYLDVSKYKLPMIANKQLVEKYKASILKDGDIIIADAAEDETVGKCSELRGIEDANILAGLHTIPSRPNWTFASGYLGYYMNSSAFHDQLLPLIQGTKISSISKSALKKTDIKYPHGKDEQTKIGNLFKQLDDSIALHQSKLERLSNLKQVLLAKIFV